MKDHIEKKVIYTFSKKNGIRGTEKNRVSRQNVGRKKGDPRL